MVFQAFLGVL